MRTADIFVKNLKKLRKAKFPRQEDFAPLVGFESVRGYQKYEQGESAPTPDLLDRLAKVLECKPWMLLAPDLSGEVKILQDTLEKQTRVMIDQSQLQIDLFKQLDEKSAEISRLHAENERLLETNQKTNLSDIELSRLKKELGVIVDAWRDLKPGRKAICLYFATGEEEFVSAFSSRTQGLLRLIFRSFDEK